MKEFNGYIETNQWLKKLMDELNEEDGMRLEDAFYAFKQHYTKAENLPISGVSASALKSAYDVCYTMKSHCGNVMAGADEGDEGYDADKEMYEKAKEFIDAYEAHLR